jgi:hypothetical protein
MMEIEEKHQQQPTAKRRCVPNEKYLGSIDGKFTAI